MLQLEIKLAITVKHRVADSISLISDVK